MNNDALFHRVHIAASGEYDILIGDGLIAQAGARIAETVALCRAAVITDDTVAALYLDSVCLSLAEAGFQPLRIVFPHGEGSKSLETLSVILETLAEARISRGDLIVALGGGVVGDMAGFAAAIYGRGMRYVQIPTTLLAAVDSSVGGKTAVNLKAGKNMAGAFKQPSFVLCDLAILRALPKALIACGAAEIVKYGVLADPDLFALLESGAWIHSLAQIVRRCVEIKADYVAADEYDEGARQFLNLGHTLGHAAEKLSGYTLTHGEGVSIGFSLIARAAAAQGYCAPDCAARIERALRACDLPTLCPYPPDVMLDAALLDKKRRGGSITLIVPRAIGQCELLRVPVEKLDGWIQSGYPSPKEG